VSLEGSLWGKTESCEGQHTQNCIFLFSGHEAGSFEDGTGQKMLDLLQSEPDYSKFLKYWEKLKAWDARKSTADDGE
jgi:hypothetical protein